MKSLGFFCHLLHFLYLLYCSAKLIFTVLINPSFPCGIRMLFGYIGDFSSVVTLVSLLIVCVILNSICSKCSIHDCNCCMYVQQLILYYKTYKFYFFKLYFCMVLLHGDILFMYLINYVCKFTYFYLMTWNIYLFIYFFSRNLHIFPKILPFI